MFGKQRRRNGKDAAERERVADMQECRHVEKVAEELRQHIVDLIYLKDVKKESEQGESEDDFLFRKIKQYFRKRGFHAKREFFHAYSIARIIRMKMNSIRKKNKARLQESPLY